VAELLFARHYALLARNVRLGALEIDIVARKGALLAVVEVRTRGRGAWKGAFESVTRVKRQRLARATRQLWRSQWFALRGIERVRLDVAAVTFSQGRTSIEYIAGALG
jgi:putative endonuclease